MKQTLADAIAEADYYATELNAYRGNEITGVDTARTFSPDQIEKWGLPPFMAWNTGSRAEYDPSADTYDGFETMKDMVDYIDAESPAIDDD